MEYGMPVPQKLKIKWPFDPDVSNNSHGAEFCEYKSICI